MDLRSQNRAAWDKLVEEGNRWTQPVSHEMVEAARQGHWEIFLTESRPVPANWFPELVNLDVLCLASGGGQQGSILAAVGARVTVFDNSPPQLDADRQVAEREGLILQTIEGDMRDLSILADESFDFIVHPVSNVFVPDIERVWQEAYRVLRAGGEMISGFMNPVEFVFDWKLREQGEFKVRYALPYSDLTSISPEEHVEFFGEDATIEFSHTLEEQIGGQMEAGFELIGLYEDYRGDSLIAEYMPSYVATRARKPAGTL